MIKIIVGNCLDALTKIPAGSVDCCVTSPPYWGLRDYGTASWEGGDEGCDHVRPNDCGPNAQVGSTKANVQRFYTAICGRCGSRRIDQQLGLEETPDSYVANLVAVFRQVRRVLRDDGTCWVNIGDSYTSGGRKNRDPGQSKIHPAYEDSFVEGGRPGTPDGLKPKDLVGIPWMVAFALQADGWYLRQDIIWHKPNPMPESVTDRCTKSHEYIFLLSKSEKYYYDHEAIQEKSTGQCGSSFGKVNRDGPGSRRMTKESHRQLEESGVRNKRSVWTVPVKPYSGAHFAVYPTELIKPCILAGCRRGGTVLDPFLGSGTTAYVARKLECHCIGIELNPEYAAIARNRLSQGVLFG